MLKLDKIKPERKTNIFMELNISTDLMTGIINNHYLNLVEELVIPTIQSGTLLTLYFIFSIPVLTILFKIVSISTFINIVIVFILCSALFVIGFIVNTAYFRIYIIRHLVEKYGISDIKGYTSIIKRRYIKRKKCIVSLGIQEDTMNVEIESFVYENCKSRQKIMLFSMHNNVLFYCSQKQLANHQLPKFTYIPKIELEDIKEYYAIVVNNMITNFKNMIKSEVEHYKNMWNDLKK